MSIASVSIVGNLVKAPQQVQFSSGKIKATMTVAVNTPFREKRGGDPAGFYKVEAWGKLAEQAVNWLNKGNQVTANGRLTLEKWIDNRGKERITPTISASDIAFPQRPKTSQARASHEEPSSWEEPVCREESSSQEPPLSQEESNPMNAKVRRSAESDAAEVKKKSATPNKKKIPETITVSPTGN